MMSSFEKGGPNNIKGKGKFKPCPHKVDIGIFPKILKKKEIVGNSSWTRMIQVDDPTSWTIGHQGYKAVW